VIVVDTNIIAYLFLDSERQTQIDLVFQADPQWAAPRFWRSEMRNVLASYLRREIVNLEESVAIMEEAIQLLHNGEYDVPSARVLALAHASGCSAYDCEFVVLAQDLGIRLVTVDRQLLMRFPDIAISPEDYLRSAGSRRQ
jgi:predicted nucleic acid-binding protein